MGYAKRKNGTECCSCRGIVGIKWKYIVDGGLKNKGSDAPVKNLQCYVSVEQKKKQRDEVTWVEIVEVAS